MTSRTIFTPALFQFLRYIVVGVLNTLVTLLVIFLCKSIWEVNPWLSNAIGYVAGLINSFVWNKLWVFHSNSKADTGREALRFAIGFLICYAIQFFVTWFLTVPLGLESIAWFFGDWCMTGYGIATIIGMVIYTLCNFIYNRLVTFR